jgi:hypothetical protein
MKIMYKDVVRPYDVLRFSLLKDMAQNLCEGVEFEELYSAVQESGEEGIFCRTKMGGKKFWSTDELTKLFVRKNRESKRFRL